MKLNLRKSKISYTVMIMSDSAKKHHTEFHIRAGAVGAVTLLTFALFVAAICYVVYSSITLSNSMERSKRQMEQIAQIKGEKEQLILEKEGLEAEIVKLEEKISILSDTVNQKVEAEQAMEAEIQEEHIPKGFPMSGTAQIKAEGDGETEDGTDGEDENAAQKMRANAERKEVIFTAAEGTNVIASGAGVVLLVNEDAEYGNMVTIDHGNGYVSAYRNGGSPMVKEGSEVARGAILYVTDEKNMDTGYSIRKDDAYVDPMELIEING